MNLKVNGIECLVSYKKIKHMYLRVRQGKVIINVPLRTTKEAIDYFVRKHLFKIQRNLTQWENRKQILLKTGKEVYLWGDSYILDIINNKENSCFIDNGKLILLTRKLENEYIKRVFDKFCREQLKVRARKELSYWEKATHINVYDMRIKKMRTRWGSCNIAERRIWLNTRLVFYHSSCLSYVVLHEVLHLRERYHNKQFYYLLDMYMPNWQDANAMLEYVYID